MGYKCGNCNRDFMTKKTWLDHIANEHESYFLEGDAESVAYHDKIMKIKAANQDTKAMEALKSKEM